MNRISSVLLALVLGAGAAAQASEQLDTVTVPLQRDPAIMAYGNVNALLAGLQKYGQGLFRFELKLKPRDAKIPLKNPKLAIEHAERYIPIPVADDGSFELPILPQEVAKEADLASNQPKGSLRIEGTLKLTTRAADLDMATVRRIVATARELRSELLPWYARWLFPQIEAVRICSVDAISLQWREQGQLVGVPVAADPADSDPDAEHDAPSPRKQCANLSGQERWPDEARLAAAADASLSVKLSR